MSAKAVNSFDGEDDDGIVFMRMPTIDCVTTPSPTKGRRESIEKGSGRRVSIQVMDDDLEEPFYESIYHSPGSHNSEIDSQPWNSSPSPMHSSPGENSTVELPLHMAVMLNDTAQVSMLLDSLPNLTRSVDAQGKTALHVACRLGYVGVAELILRSCFNVNASDCTGKTCLHYCTNHELCAMLLDAGASPNHQDDQGNTPLHFAVMAGNLKCVQAMLYWGANPTITDSARARTAVHVAVDVGNPALLSCILIDSKHAIYLDSPDCDGNAAIHIAAMSTSATGQQQQLIMMLLDRGASALVLNNRLISALHYVCANRFLCTSLLAEPLVEILLDQGASPNAMDNEGCTPLAIAATHREWGICKLLLEAGGDLNMPCPMNSYLLQQGVAFNVARDDFLKQSDCTANDLLPRKARAMLFQYICVAQTFIPAEKRDRCMNCGEQFLGASSDSIYPAVKPSNSSGKSTTSSARAPSSDASGGGWRNGFGAGSSSKSFFSGSMGFSFSVSAVMQSLSLSSGKHHCRMCNRVVCQECSANQLEPACMPDFVVNRSKRVESSYRVCKVCFGVLTSRQSSSSVS